MPQMHMYLSAPVAEEVKRRAALKGLPVSKYLAELVQEQIRDRWPEGYLEQVLGGCADSPLRRGPQGEADQRDPW